MSTATVHPPDEREEEGDDGNGSPTTIESFFVQLPFGLLPLQTSS